MSNLNQKCFSHDDMVSISENNRVVDIPFSELMERINYLRMREWQDIVSQLKKSIAELGFSISQSDTDYQGIHQAMASGLLSHIGNKDKDKEYLGARNSRFMLFPGSGIAKASPKWLMVAELVDTSRLFGRMGAKIEPQWLESLAPHLIKRSYSEPHWSKNKVLCKHLKA